MTRTRCHWHPRRLAVCCGVPSRRGYCRACHALASRALPRDAAIWLAA